MRKPKERERERDREPERASGTPGFSVYILYIIYSILESLIVQRILTRDTHKKYYTTAGFLLSITFVSDNTHTNRYIHTRGRARADTNNNGPNNNKYNCELSSSLKLYHTTIIIHICGFFYHFVHILPLFLL